MQTTCQLCNQDVRTLPSPNTNTIVDGATVSGPWAYMCRPCHKKFGMGTGLGRGQVYNVVTGEKIDG